MKKNLLVLALTLSFVIGGLYTSVFASTGCSAWLNTKGPYNSYVDCSSGWCYWNNSDHSKFGYYDQKRWCTDTGFEYQKVKKKIGCGTC